MRDTLLLEAELRSREMTPVLDIANDFWRFYRLRG
jgi:hypothetical protein